jgi:cytochrome c oxidase assembly protein subunit 15
MTPFQTGATRPTTPRAPSSTPRALGIFATAVAVCTGLLVFAGGLVTSTGSGLAVPDWPLSYGELMPPMVGNVRFEHGHRMVATAVGMLTVVLAVWLWKREPRRAVRRLGLVALAAVVVQGLLGGLTVLLFLPAPVSVAHGALGQTFFCMTVVLALVTSAAWQRPVVPRQDAAGGPSLRTLAVACTAIVYVQLILGATMRHREAGLAIPDFPLAFGRLVPPFTSPEIAIHFAHRVWALVVTAAAAWVVVRVWRAHRTEPALVRPAAWLAAFLVAQIALGATAIWTQKAVVPTTLHVLNGALVLATSLVLTLQAFRCVAPRAVAPARAPVAAAPPPAFGEWSRT